MDQQRYLDRLASEMQRKLPTEWKPEAQRISRLLQESGLLHQTPPLTNPQQFVVDAISSNPLIAENSYLPRLVEMKYQPQAATSAFEIASLLVPPESA